MSMSIHTSKASKGFKSGLVDYAMVSNRLRYRTSPELCVRASPSFAGMRSYNSDRSLYGTGQVGIILYDLVSIYGAAFPSSPGMRQR
jgi:hypothetical protein